MLNSDSPTLPTALLIETAEVLARPGDRAVLGPSSDGGYYLLGLKAAHRRMFEDIAWSTERVAAQTLERAREIGLEVHSLPVWYDVDDVDGLRRLNAELGGEDLGTTPGRRPSAALRRADGKIDAEALAGSRIRSPRRSSHAGRRSARLSRASIRTFNARDETIMQRAATNRAVDPKRYFESVQADSEVPEHEPVCLYLETTNRCNLLCTTCPRTYEELEPPADMSWELFTSIVDQIPNLHRAVLHGVGEPMLVKHLPRMVRYLKDRGTYVLFNTNGTVLNEKNGRALIAGRSG